MTLEPSYSHVTPEQVRQIRESGAAVLLVDVRTRAEYAQRHISGVLLIPLDEFAARCRTLDPGAEIVCLCEHGIRSEMAAQYLASLGYSRAATMTGGMAAYSGPTETGNV
jgi:rhodanese-related sulfurtransferase